MSPLGGATDDGAGAENDVAGEQRAFALEHEDEMIGRVTGRVQRGDRRVAGRHAFAVGQRAVVRKARRRDARRPARRSRAPSGAAAG